MRRRCVNRTPCVVRCRCVGQFRKRRPIGLKALRQSQQDVTCARELETGK
ncbi:MAG: hypothetical protein IH899_20605 [Planctomycetes bacterium]|nr:hypothetical protein [Planctomycetota bacterium]